ncbi:MAG: alpha/beta fold hydrolase [Planctomycetota bacterium]
MRALIAAAAMLTILSASAQVDDSSAALATAFAEREASFATDVSLAGELLVPDGDGPHACVLILPGRGCYARAGRRPLAEMFAEAGIAALIFDMRGTGESEGDCPSATFPMLTGDAEAALQWAADQPEIDVDRMGVLATSAGAWSAYALADTSIEAEMRRLREGNTRPPLAFVITQIGPATSIETQQRESAERFAEALGLSPESAALVQRHIDIAIDPTIDKFTSFERFEAIRSVAEEEGWFGDMFAPDDFPATVDEVDSIFLRRFRYDPKRSLENLSQTSVLAIFGEDDPIVPVESNTAELKRATGAAGNDDVSIVVLPGVGHEVTDEFVAIAIEFLRERGLLTE